MSSSHRIDNEFALKHGHARKIAGHSGTYNAWVDMRRRCQKVSHPAYKLYGARGITVCDRWSCSFPDFLADMGVKPARFTLERIDNDGNYEPGNCRWASVKEQSNNRRTNVTLTVNGESLTIVQWAEKLGTGKSTLQMRLKAGWSHERTVQTPVRKKNVRK
jgi:hypothetical protein